jgi:transposase
MEAIFIEELLGYVDFQVGRVEEKSDGIHIYGCSRLETGLSKNMELGKKVMDWREREVRELPILNRPVILHIRVRKFKTAQGDYFWEELSFVRPHSHFTKRYEEYIFTRSKGSDLSQVATQEGLTADTVQGIYHYYAQKNSIV